MSGAKFHEFPQLTGLASGHYQLGREWGASWGKCKGGNAEKGQINHEDLKNRENPADGVMQGGSQGFPCCVGPPLSDDLSKRDV